MTMELQSARNELVEQKPLSAPLRGTQSFLATLARCWRHPSLLGLELLWRWGIGIPALALIGGQAYKILSSVSLAHTGIEHFSLIDTVGAAQILSAVADVLLPHIRAVAIWLAPLLAVAWVLASGFGRSLVLRRYDRTLRSAPWLLAGMQMLRIVAFGGSFIAWFACLHWAAWTSLNSPDPNLVGYFIKAIFLSFAIFLFWAVVSWVFSIAPLLALLEGTGMAQSIRASLRFGQGSLRGLRPKLVEINLVLCIVKAALIVLAMVFCTTPVPFKEEINGPSLYAWWALVTVWYFAACDFFQMARVIGFIDLWRSANRPIPGTPVSSG
ncbi:MAG TPA: hypothetical protein VN670_01100 [Acidobacteriaceae bacterium]|nr:hypothetical protein [Acidobacteriaceae bacterium]